MKSSFSIAKSTYSWVWLSKILILKSLLPILFICLVAVYFDSIPLIFISLILGCYYTATIMVQVHRTIISGISADDIKMFPKIEKTFFLYLGAWFVLSIVEKIYDKIMDRILFDANLFLGIIGIILSLVFVYVGTRVYLLFPILAVKNKLDFRLAFFLSKDKFWIIFNSFLLMLLPLIIFFMAMFGLIVLVLEGLNADFHWQMVGLFGLYFVTFTIFNIHYSLLFLELDKDQKTQMLSKTN